MIDFEWFSKYIKWSLNIEHKALVWILFMDTGPFTLSKF